MASVAALEGCFCFAGIFAACAGATPSKRPPALAAAPAVDGIAECVARFDGAGAGCLPVEAQDVDFGKAKAAQGAGTDGDISPASTACDSSALAGADSAGLQSFDVASVGGDDDGQAVDMFREDCDCRPSPGPDCRAARSIDDAADEATSQIPSDEGMPEIVLRVLASGPISQPHINASVARAFANVTIAYNSEALDAFASVVFDDEGAREVFSDTSEAKMVRQGWRDEDAYGGPTSAWPSCFCMCGDE